MIISIIIHQAASLGLGGRGRGTAATSFSPKAWPDGADPTSPPVIYYGIRQYSIVYHIIV